MNQNIFGVLYKIEHVGGSCNWQWPYYFNPLAKAKQEE